jgi:DNA-binding CsgD family transcriptional regulator
MIYGPAGVGKTRLCAELVAGARDAGMQVLTASATRSGRELPLAPFASLLGDSIAATAVSPNAQYEVLASALEVLRARYGSERFIVAVDDGQLLDEASATLIHHLATSGAAFVVITVRSDEPAPDAIDALWKNEIAPRLDLEPLDEVQVSEFCSRALGGQVEAPTRHRLFQACGGNLLYLRELLLSGLHAGTLARSHEVWSWNGAIEPGERLAALVASRLEASSDDVRRVLELLAVGDAVELDVLLELVDPDAVEAAESAGYISIGTDERRSVAQLAHPLMGDVLRSTMTELARRRVAGGLADALASTGARRNRDVLRIAAFELGAGRRQHGDRLLAAAIQARHLGDLGLGERLARAAREAGAGVAAEVELDDCLIWQGRFDEVSDTVSMARVGERSPRLLAHAARNRASALFFGRGDVSGANAVLEEAEGLLAGDPIMADVRSHRSELAMFAADLTVAEELARCVLHDPSAPSVARASAYGALVPTLALSGRVDDAAAVGDEALAWLLAQPEPPLWEGAGIVVGQFLAALIGGRLDRFEPVLASLYEDAAGKPLDPMRGVWALMLGRSAAARGALEVATDRLREAAELLRQYDPGRVLPWCLGSLAQAEGQRGNARAACAAVEEMDQVQVPALRAFAVDLELGRAWAAAAAGEIKRARAITIDATTDALERTAYGVAGYALHVAFRFGARDTSELWAPIVPHAQGALLATGCAISESPRDPDVLLVQADALADCGMHLWAAELAAIAGVLASGSDAVETRARAGIVRGHELGFCGQPGTPALAWAAERSVSEVLTARELEIGRLVASGLSNPEIASRLVLSRRTVENHLASTYRKLGISSRVDLTDLLGGDLRRE